MRITGNTIRRRRRALRELAALWCSILACDRATNAWSLRLHGPDLGPPALRLAWRAFYAAASENYRERERWVPGVTKDTRAEQWARAESLLRSGWRHNT